MEVYFNIMDIRGVISIYVHPIDVSSYNAVNFVLSGRVGYSLRASYRFWSDKQERIGLFDSSIDCVFCNILQRLAFDLIAGETKGYLNFTKST
jgi:hypothetical protein